MSCKSTKSIKISYLDKSDDDFLNFLLLNYMLVQFWHAISNKFQVYKIELYGMLGSKQIFNSYNTFDIAFKIINFC